LKRLSLQSQLRLAVGTSRANEQPGGRAASPTSPSTSSTEHLSASFSSAGSTPLRESPLLQGLVGRPLRRSLSLSALSGAHAAFTSTGSCARTAEAAGRRPLSTFVSPTVFAHNRKGDRVVVDPGHVQFQTTPEERQAHGLAAAYGHSPMPGAPRSSLVVEGELNDGRSFRLSGVQTAARPYGEDTRLDGRSAGGIAVDHGPISAERAARLRDLGHRPLLPFYQTIGANCVDAHVQVLEEVFDFGLDVSAHTTPQELAQLAQPMRADPGVSSQAGAAQSTGNAAATWTTGAVTQQVGQIAAEVQKLLDHGRPEAARAEAQKLLDPQLVAQLNSARREGHAGIGSRETLAMDLANAHYMELLTVLADQRLLDARQVFGRLLETQSPRNTTPYLMHIASRAASRIAEDRSDQPATRQMAHAAFRLLDKVAGVREQAGEKNVRPAMREALLTQKHTGQLSMPGNPKYGDWVDFYSRMLGTSQHARPEASLTAVAGLEACGLMPERGEFRAAGASRWQAGKIREARDRAVAHAARSAKAPPSPAITRAGDAAKHMAQLDIARARAADVRLQAQRAEMEAARRREENAFFHIYLAVSGAVNERWEPLARQARRALAPHGLAGMLNPARASALASAAQSVSLSAPRELVSRMCTALIATPEGEAVIRGLKTGRPCPARERAAFDRLLQDMVGTGVQTTLEGLETDLRTNAQAMSAASAARDTAVREERQSAANAANAAMAQDTARVQARADEVAATANTLPQTSLEGPRAHRHAARDEDVSAWSAPAHRGSAPPGGLSAEPPSQMFPLAPRGEPSGAARPRAAMPEAGEGAARSRR
jgi:hypothetical protein